MEKLKRNQMKIRPATLLALLALFVAIGGTATAASGVINGKKIKKGTIAGKAFKNQTITRAKISTATIASLAGARGPQGEKGAKGSKGPNGDQGAPGAPGTSTISGSATKIQAANSEVNQVVLDDLPGSRYIAFATVTARSQNAGSEVVCRIEALVGNQDEATWTNTVNDSRGVLWMAMSTENEVTQVKLVCNPGTSSGNLKSHLTLVPAL